jgi:hypothetical protein
MYWVGRFAVLNFYVMGYGTKKDVKTYCLCLAVRARAGAFKRPSRFPRW